MDVHPFTRKLCLCPLPEDRVCSCSPQVCLREGLTDAESGSLIVRGRPEGRGGGAGVAPLGRKWPTPLRMVC